MREPAIVPMASRRASTPPPAPTATPSTTSEVPDPFSVHRAWHVKEPLSLDVLRLACDPLIGSHDFTSFCRRPKRPTAPRPRSSATSARPGGRWSTTQTLRFWIEASSFCHQMVRSIVGTLVDVGLGKLHAGDIRGILAARDRRAAGSGRPAPRPDALAGRLPPDSRRRSSGRPAWPPPRRSGGGGAQTCPVPGRLGSARSGHLHAPGGGCREVPGGPGIQGSTR